MVRPGDPAQSADAAREQLSALADGEIGVHEVAAVVSRCCERSDLGATWHAYQLIGDVLRSDELCGRGRDRAFIARLRNRLELEPVVLAPTRLVSDAPDRRLRSPAQRWTAAVGAIGGVALVVSAWMATRTGPAGGEVVAVRATAVAAATPPAASALERARVQTVNPPQPPLVAVRDARLDRYLKAHKQYPGANALGPTPGFLRSATYDTVAR